MQERVRSCRQQEAATRLLAAAPGSTRHRGRVWEGVHEALGGDRDRSSAIDPSSSCRTTRPVLQRGQLPTSALSLGTALICGSPDEPGAETCGCPAGASVVASVFGFLDPAFAFAAAEPLVDFAGDGESASETAIDAKISSATLVAVRNPFGIVKAPGNIGGHESISDARRSIVLEHRPLPARRETRVLTGCYALQL